MFVTERSGRLVKIGKDKKVISVLGVKHYGEGGLLGMALDPKFQQNHFLYLYLTSNTSGKLENRVERYTFNNDSISERKIIIEGIAGSIFHDGGRLAFGPDGYFYLLTNNRDGRGTPKEGDDKIIRINPELLK